MFALMSVCLYLLTFLLSKRLDEYESELGLREAWSSAGYVATFSAFLLCGVAGIASIVHLLLNE